MFVFIFTRVYMGEYNMAAHQFPFPSHSKSKAIHNLNNKAFFKYILYIYIYIYTIYKVEWDMVR